jgi:hypothetical protein
VAGFDLHLTIPVKATGVACIGVKLCYGTNPRRFAFASKIRVFRSILIHESFPHSFACVDSGTCGLDCHSAGRRQHPHRIAGFTYLPRQDGNPNGTVEKYRFETSMDGVNWTTVIASGMFANIRNNPSLQEVHFDPVNARFFRFTALREVNGNGWTSAAEISVLPAAGSGNTTP